MHTFSHLTQANVNQSHKIQFSAGKNGNLFWLDGNTAIIQAASRGHNKILDQLLAAGAKADACLKDGTSGLYLAAQVGSLHAVRSLLGVAPGLLDKPRKDSVKESSSTALAMACNGGHVAIVRFLIEAGASLDCSHTSGGPVGFAVEAGKLQVLKMLLNANASPNTTCDGKTPLYVASQLDGGPLPGAQLMQALLDAKAEVNTEVYVPPASPGPMLRMHALSHTALHGKLTTLRMLISARADLNVRNEQGATPLLLAIGGRHEECALACLVAGADPNIGLHAGTRFSPNDPKNLGMHGNKTLHEAVYNNLPRIVQVQPAARIPFLYIV